MFWRSEFALAVACCYVSGEKEARAAAGPMLSCHGHSRGDLEVGRRPHKNS